MNPVALSGDKFRGPPLPILREFLPYSLEELTLTFSFRSSQKGRRDDGQLLRLHLNCGNRQVGQQFEEIAECVEEGKACGCSDGTVVGI